MPGDPKAPEATIVTAVTPPEPKLPIELGSLWSLPYVQVRQGIIIMPGVPSKSSPATAAINKVTAPGPTQDNMVCDLVLRSDL